jgi:SAM-dependent methyltransferase
VKDGCEEHQFESQRTFWNDATHKKFGHPIHEQWLARYIAKDADILDYGCGYGRVLHLLRERGYSHLTGVDFAPRMIEVASGRLRDVKFQTLGNLPLPFPDASFDAVFLIAVLTCIPATNEQRELAMELCRVLRSAGTIYISDMPLQDDDLHRNRYEDGKVRFGVHGVFRTTDGAIVRHHTLDHLRHLFPSLEAVESRTTHVRTMSGTSVQAAQLLMRRV